MELAGLAAQHVAETGSTNSDLLARVHAAAAAGDATFSPCLLVASRQTSGRGRHGRRWHGEAGASLTFSLAWPFAAGHDLAGLSLAVGVALAEALEPVAADDGRRPRLVLKWPNDLLLVDGHDDAGAARKLGGVLIETAPFAAGRVAVIGIGLNIAALRPVEAASGVAWLGELDAGATPQAALHRVAAPLVAGLRRFTADGFAAFATGFDGRDFLRGRRVTFAGGAASPAEPISGTAGGVSAQGELLVATPRGLMPVASGEVRLRFDRRAEPASC